MKALILAPFAEASLQRLGQRLDVTYEPWTETRRLQDPQQLAERLRRDGIAFLVVEADFLFEEVFAVPGFRLAGVCRNALNLVDLEAATRHGVPVVHTPHRNAFAVAELTTGLMLALARHVPAAHVWLTGGNWTNPLDAYARFRGREVAGSVVGVIGLGAIGAEVARRAQCLNARVIASDPFVRPDRAKALGVRLVSLRELLRRSDFVTLHTIATKATERLIDGAALDLMKPTAYLLSTGAGAAVDLDALVDRLRQRRLAGAALDVYPGHILPATSPLLELENVILTPHIGGATGETISRHSQMMVEDIERFLEGKRPRRVANPDALKAKARAR